jgi:hypothetical protein
MFKKMQKLPEQTEVVESDKKINKKAAKVGQQPIIAKNLFKNRDKLS